MYTTKIYNLLIIDQSASMSVIQDQTINGCNETLQTIQFAQERYPDQNHLITLVTFNSNLIKTLLDCAPVRDAEPLSYLTYQPNGTTPLYDAIGLSIARLRSIINTNEEHHVLVTILTDGEENSSTEYRFNVIKQLIDELKKIGWTFTFIGANIDVERISEDLSVDNYLIFEQTQEGTKNMFITEAHARMNLFDKIAHGFSKEELSKKYYDKH